MANKKQKNKNDRLSKKYTHPEFLEEFFPNIDPNEAQREDSVTLTEDQFLDILVKVTGPLPLPPAEEKSGT